MFSRASASFFRRTYLVRGGGRGVTRNTTPIPPQSQTRAMGGGGHAYVVGGRYVVIINYYYFICFVLFYFYFFGVSTVAPHPIYDDTLDSHPPFVFFSLQ